ncbi:MAG: hypothetical protein M1342_02170 [Patescibacteria group bacterium]|nr:hypothetical protein [Patescibacteria group bacterium]
MITPGTVMVLAQQGVVDAHDVLFHCGGPGSPGDPTPPYSPGTLQGDGELVPAANCQNCSGVAGCRAEVYHTLKPPSS